MESGLHAQPLARLIQPHANVADAGAPSCGLVMSRRIFGSIPFAFFIENLLATHDQGQVEVFCYADMVKPDATIDRLRKSGSASGAISRAGPTGRFAQLIRQDQIDILVDLAGHTGGNRLLAFATKPAPVQVTYLGYFDYHRNGGDGLPDDRCVGGSAGNDGAVSQ